MHLFLTFFFVMKATKDDLARASDVPGNGVGKTFAVVLRIGIADFQYVHTCNT